MVAEKELKEIDRREREYRGGRPFPALQGATVVLVDDGVATGSTMLAAVQAAKLHQPAAVIVAAPVMSLSADAALRQVADACVYVAAPEPFYGVAAWYADFAQTTDEEVRELVKLGGQQAAPAGAGPAAQPESDGSYAFST